MKDFADKVVVITGAGSGIGRALAVRLASAGAHLALSDIDDAGLRETVAMLPGADHLGRRFDVSDRAAMTAFRGVVLEKFGQVDVVINNAGVTVVQSAAETTFEDFEWIVGVNFWGVIHGSQLFLPDLLAREEAALVNISSIFGSVAFPHQSAYNATKFAVRGFTEALRLETAGTPLQVMCVQPGGIRTSIVRNGRFHRGPDGEDRDAAIARFEAAARTTPEQAAETILRGLRRRQARCLIGADAKLADLIQRLLPVHYFRVLSRLLPKAPAED